MSNAFNLQQFNTGVPFFYLPKKIYLKFDSKNSVLVHAELIYQGMWFADVKSIKKTCVIVNDSKSGNITENKSIEFTNMVFI